MNRQDVVLAVLAAGNGASHSPVQTQKLLFLLDAKIPERISGPHFNFRPYSYGPFDAAVYQELRQLADSGLAESVQKAKYSVYRTTPEGQSRGERILDNLPSDVSDYIRRLSAWVRSLTFEQLVSTIYHRYPEMKVNSVFRG